MGNKKQTAVEWLIEQCPRIETIVADYIIEQAKEIDRNNIINAAARGFLAMPEKFNLEDAKEFGKQYYNNTYDNNNNISTN
jgi:hypothetical protein